MRLLACFCLLVLAANPALSQDSDAAAVDPEIAAQIAAYQDVAAQLIDAALADSVAYERLAYMADTFGPRFSGTQELEDAIDWILEMMEADGLDNVRGEPVMVPRWVRGDESLTMTAPRTYEMSMLGLGGSIGTGPDGVEAEVLVVTSFDDLKAHAEEAIGKIVLYNVPFTSYGPTVQYRVNGAIEASKVGAVASLVRSVGPVSLYTPHTGTSRYEDGVPPIPHAAVTVEDAIMMQRMQDRGQQIRVRLYMEAETLPDVESRNVVAEIRGREKPEEIVVFGGHIDSWDVGQGAMDDGGGCIAAWHVLLLMKQLGLQPRRTIRVVLWTNEENGLRGADAYRDTHLSEVENHVLALETDSGIFKPEGFGFTGRPDAYVIVREIGKLLEPIGAGDIRRGGGGADISPLMRLGVPGMGLRVAGDTYFWYHHTPADTVDKIDPHDMNLAAAAMGIMTYVVADLPEALPRTISVPGNSGR